MTIRLRDLNLSIGRLPMESLNTITDVQGVKVGHTTLIEGDGDHAIRTGVTVVLPHDGDLFHDKCAAGVFTINGFGKAVGFEQIRTLGTLETPIVLTNTLNIPRVSDAMISYMLNRHEKIGRREGTVNVVVGECNDGFLNDIRARSVTEQHVLDAIESATSENINEGNVGAGTGTSCMGFKGGIGTSSRVVADGKYTLGALVQTNFGSRRDLTVCGVPVGKHLLDVARPYIPPGSIMIVLATDAPLSTHQLTLVAQRAAFGIARVGGYAHVGSGDFVITFSTTNRFPHDADPEGMTFERVHDSHIQNQLYLATVESVEEAILNSLIAAESMTGLKGRIMPNLPHDDLLRIMKDYGYPSRTS